MNGKTIFAITAVLFAGTLFADTLMEVRPGEVVKDNWKKDRGTFKAGSSKDNVSVVSEKGKSFARYMPGGNTYYNLKDIKDLGTENLTITVLIRVNGKNGNYYVLCSGAGSHVSPGYRLGISVKDGKISPYVLFVAASSTETSKKFVSFNADKKIIVEPGKWFVLTLSANRSGDLQLFYNGELAGSKSMKVYGKENIFPKAIPFSTYCHKAADGTEAPLQLDIAEVIVRNELMSSSQIMNEAEDMLDEMAK